MLRLVRVSSMAGGLAIVGIALTFGAVYSAHDRLERWVRHSREVARLAQQVVMLAGERQRDIGTDIVRSRPRVAGAATYSASALRRSIDSLVALTAGDPVRYEAALQVRTELARSERRVASPLAPPAVVGSAVPVANSAAVAAERAFEPARGAMLRLAASEEAEYARNVAREEWLQRLAAVGIVLELVLAVLVIERLGRRVLVEATAATRHEAELVARSGELESLNHALVERTAEAERARTDAEASAAAARRAHDELRAVVDTSPLAIVVSDLDGAVVQWNHAAERIFGWSFADAAGQPLTIVPRERVEEFDTIRRDLLAGATLNDHRTQCRRRDGTVVDVSLSATAMHGMDGAPTALLAIYADVGARVRLEAELRQAQKMEAVGRLAGGVAHDFNNLLTVIISFSSMVIADAGDGVPWASEMREINQAATRAARLTRQLLAFSRRQVLRSRVVDLNPAIEELEQMLRRLIGEDVELATELDPSLWPVRVDIGQIEQVIMNLAVNARDAMPQGGQLRITTCNAPSLPQGHASARGTSVAPGDYVCIAMSDTGCGMAEEVQAHLFEPFFTTKGVGKGTGLGLSTSFGIVQQSGGFMVVDSAPDQGSIFRVFLPRAAPLPAAVPADAAETHPQGAETVLLVEDDAHMRGAVRAMLERSGHRVLAADGGAQALGLLDRFHGSIDLVLTDVVMPRIGGRELARRIRERWPSLPLLFMSGYAAEAVQGCWALEADAVRLEKPFTAEALALGIRDAMRRARRPLGRPAA